MARAKLMVLKTAPLVTLAFLSTGKPVSRTLAHAAMELLLFLVMVPVRWMVLKTALLAILALH
jgi:hypothetical protein